jgi:hypothetical protein
MCSMGFIAAGDARYFDISLNTIAAGTFTSNVSILAANDSNAGNNASAIALSVTEPAVIPPPAPPAAPPPSGGGGGGGGSLEWFAVVFLALMVLRGKVVGLRARIPRQTGPSHSGNWRFRSFERECRSVRRRDLACRTAKRTAA